jgi:hypothetical protein
MALPAIEDFNRDDNVALGTNWTTLNTGGFGVSSNNVYPNCSGDCGSIWNADSFADDHYAQLGSIVAVNSAGDYAIGVCVRGAVSGARYYGYIGLARSAERYLIRNSGGSPTALQHYTGSGISIGDSMELRAVGSLITPILNGSTDSSLGTATDATYSNGSAGLAGYSASNLLRGDNWVGGNITSGGATVQQLLMMMGMGS